MSVSQEQLSRYTYNSLFIETGTYRGRCVQAALELGFEKIISIEINSELYAKACERFKSYPNVKLILGDSVKVLEEVLSTIEQPATIYLDAHGDIYGRGDSLNNRQVLNELEVIKKFYKKGSVIIIDDFVEMFPSNESRLNLTNKLLEIDGSLKMYCIDGAKFKPLEQRQIEYTKSEDILIAEEDLVMDNSKVYISFGAILEQEVRFLLEKHPNLLVVAYDPLDACFEQYLLIDNPRFRPYKYAVSDFTGEAVLQVGITGIQSTMVPYVIEKAFRKDGSPEYSEESQKINVVSAESVLLQYPEIDRLDINAEGSEIQILMGTPLSVLARCKRIHVEFHIFAKWFEMTQEQVDKCAERLSSHFDVIINDPYHPCYTFIRKEL